MNMMKKWLRRLRGVIGTGLTWAAVWTPIGTLIGLVVGSVLGAISLGAITLLYAEVFAALGFVGGTVLSTAGATVLRPGVRSSWAVAVIAAMAQLATCILVPLSGYLLYLLFRPQVMRACISRAFGEPTNMP